MKGLQELVTEMDFVKTSEEFNDEKGEIWISLGIKKTDMIPRF